ncbi:hypothetical protein [Aequorivita flava]|uniref:Uncharacterized protein n=1 Tax=Aequorivita flava TaxID=3114371 RepID=A0AB35YU51_9FLAO
MGIINFFKKKKKSEFEELLNRIDESSQNANSGLQFYNFAYNYLPVKLFSQTDALLQDLYNREKQAVIVNYVGSCMETGEMPKKSDIEEINVEINDKNGAKITTIGFPIIQNPSNNGLPLLPPIFIGIYEHQNALRYFVLGTGLFGSPTLREVCVENNDEVINMNLGSASGDSQDSFINDILSMI